MTIREAISVKPLSKSQVRTVFLVAKIAQRRKFIAL